MNTIMKMMIKLVFMTMLVVMTSCRINMDNGMHDTTPTQVEQINQTTTMQQFDVVDVAGSFKVVYEQGEEYSVRIEASEQAFKEMTVYVKDGELRIRQSVSKPTVSFADVKVYVTSSDIKRIELAGSGLFAASNPINAGKDLDVEIAGSGKVLLAAVKCQDSGLEIAGSGNIEIGNLMATDVKTSIAGSGNIMLDVMTCQDFNTDIAGSGDVNCDNINADNVKVEIAGSGDVNLKGTVKNLTKDIAGSGKVNMTELNYPPQKIDYNR